MAAAVPSDDDMDPRHKWLIERISNILGIYDTKYAAELITEHVDLIQAFFDDDIASHDDVRKQIMFVWRTFYDKMVEETITVLEEVPPPTPPPKTTKKPRRGGKYSFYFDTTAILSSFFSKIVKKPEPIDVRPPSPIYIEVQVNDTDNLIQEQMIIKFLNILVPENHTILCENADSALLLWPDPTRTN